MMPAMRIVTALLAAAALTCASRQSLPACVDLSGTGKLDGPPARPGTGSTSFLFTGRAARRTREATASPSFSSTEGPVLNKIEALTITQPGSRLELHATGDGGKI